MMMMESGVGARPVGHTAIQNHGMCPGHGSVPPLGHLTTAHAIPNFSMTGDFDRTI